MNDIINLLDLEDSNLNITDVTITSNKKYVTLETDPTIHFCPVCNFRMHSRGTKTRTINHPILQDTYQLIIKLKQRRWPSIIFGMTMSFCCRNMHQFL